MNKLPAEKVMPFLEKLYSGDWFYVDGRIYKKTRLNTHGKTVELPEPVIASKVCPQGYRRLSIGNRYYKEHRLIFAYFHGIDELLAHECIDHIDGDKQNNRIENLRGLSVRQNTLEAEKLGLFKRTYGEINGQCKLSKQDIKEIKDLYAYGLSQYKIAALYNVSQSHVSEILNGNKRKYA